MPLDQIQQQAGSWSVALVGHLLHDLPIGVVVEVERIGAEHRISTQSIGLMDLEVEADGSHPGMVPVPHGPQADR